MTNFLKETTDLVIESGYSPSTDIAWIGSADGTYAITWEQFRKLANFDYDSGYGAQEIPNDLVILMYDGSWFDRFEYDGAEGWVHQRTPTRQPDAKLIVNLNGRDRGLMWCSVRAFQPKVRNDD
jgi:hypothetical protein